MPEEPIILRQSFCTFLYPFQFRAQGFDEITARVKLDSHKSHPAWIPHVFQNEDLLPHVANFLNCPSKPAGKPSGAIALSWDLHSDPLGHHDFLGGRCAWTCLNGHGDSQQGVEFELTEVNLTLFATGVGFLRLQVKLKTENLESWQDFIHSFRFVEGRRSPLIQVRRKTGKDLWAPCLPGVLGAEPPGDMATGTFRMRELIRSLLRRFLVGKADAHGTVEQLQPSVYMEGRMIPYAGLFINGVAAEQRMRIVYIMKNFFLARQGDNPAPDDLSPQNPDYIQYTDSSWFVLSLDGAGFVAFDAPDSPFFTETLPRHLASDQYYIVFLMVQHQRLFLMGLSKDVAGYWGESEPARRALLFDQLRDRLLFFTSNGYFHQIMQCEHHHRVYRLWQDKLQVHDLFEEVSKEIRDIHERSLLKLQERAQKHADRLNSILFLLAPISLAFGLAQTVGGFISAPFPAPPLAVRLAFRVGAGALLLGFGLGLSTVLFSLLLKRSARN